MTTRQDTLQQAIAGAELTVDPAVFIGTDIRAVFTLADHSTVVVEHVNGMVRARQRKDGETLAHWCAPLGTGTTPACTAEAWAQAGS